MHQDLATLLNVLERFTNERSTSRVARHLRAQLLRLSESTAPAEVVQDIFDNAGKMLNALTALRIHQSPFGFLETLALEHIARDLRLHIMQKYSSHQQELLLPPLRSAS